MDAPKRKKVLKYNDFKKDTQWRWWWCDGGERNPQVSLFCQIILYFKLLHFCCSSVQKPVKSAAKVNLVFMNLKDPHRPKEEEKNLPHKKLKVMKTFPLKWNVEYWCFRLGPRPDRPTHFHTTLGIRHLNLLSGNA